jgi:cytochrome P450
MQSGSSQKHLPAPTVLSRMKSGLLVAAFIRDPVGALERHFMPAGRAIEITAMRRGRARQLFMFDPDYNRQFLLNTRNTQIAQLWPAAPRHSAAQRELRSQPLKNYGPQQAAFTQITDPYLSRGAIARQFEDIRASVLAEVSGWKPGVHDFYTLARRCTERVAFTLLFGSHESGRFSAFGDLLHEYHRANWAPAARLFPVELPGSAYRDVIERAKTLQSYIHDWIKSAGATPEGRSLVQSLVQGKGHDGCPFSQGSITAAVAMLSWLSYETTATALSWATLLLAEHPAVLADLLDEIAGHLPIEDIDADTLMALPLLDAVVKEAMRLIPPVPFMCFRTVNDAEIAGQSLARGSRFYVVPQLTHRLPELYAAPDRFRPGRWFSIKPTPYEYLPFGAGQRRCPGAWLAETNLKLALAMMLSRFRPCVPAGARFDRMYAVVTMPKNGVPLDLIPHDQTVGIAANTSYTGSIYDLFTAEPDRPVIH